MGKAEAAAAGPEQGQVLCACCEVGQPRETEQGAFSSGWSPDCAGQSEEPGAHSDSPCLQAAGAGQRGGAEEDFSSQLNLSENLACSPSS